MILNTNGFVGNPRPCQYTLDSEFVAELKFNECLTAELQQQELDQRVSVDVEHTAIAMLPIRPVRLRV